ncbi:MAG: hypothetical protein ACTSVF_05560 [Candidatus Asgardarchaeia archaeon]
MGSESSCVKVEILDFTYSAGYESFQQGLGVDKREIRDEISCTSSINLKDEILRIYLVSLKNMERKRILFEKIMKELQTMMKDRLKDWKEEEHDATKLLFRMFKGKSR